MRATAVLAPVAMLALAAPAFAAKPARVTFLEGPAEVERKGRWRALAKGNAIAPGTMVRTGKKSRLEVTFTDGSCVRVAPESRLTLTDSHFAAKRRKKVSVRLWVGRLWAHVVKGAGGAFEVKTENAVSGVRGTSFAVFAAADASAIVRVYAGSVGVRPAIGETGSRRRVSGPRQVDRRQWEESVASAMKQIKISKAGDIAPAEDFEDSGSALKWAQWNQARDRGR